MAITSINSVVFKNMFITGARYLESKKRYCNELNVFPVPDGDTGTNMTLTVLAAVKEVENVDPNSMKEIAKAISSGSLRGARGNSGVILSQLFRGYTKEISEYEEIDAIVLANALTRGVETAYKAVMKPKEGTILTVAKEAALKAVELSAEHDDLLYIMEQVIIHAEDTLQRTPDMLPVLKEAGVVDAGGQGLMYVFRGAYMVLEQGGDVDITFEIDARADEVVEMNVQHIDHNIQFGYCTEFIINVPGDIESERESLGIRMYLETIGDSIVAVADEDVIKIHVHTNEPGLALQKALSVGSLSNIKIDNMREQHETKVVTTEMLGHAVVDAKDYKDFGFVTICSGDGISEIFRSLGADYVVQGGQTMNPSTDDIISAISKVYAKEV
ncbi:MAG: DAK2 domain-containing protein, partial [Vallitaleaceae bacterium]|nr:DAK2 domain-containing protein [Vallitaleaceae bacterium]